MSPLDKAERIVGACRSTTITRLPPGTVLTSDVIRHLREGGLMVFDRERVKKLTAATQVDQSVLLKTWGDHSFIEHLRRTALYRLMEEAEVATKFTWGPDDRMEFASNMRAELTVIQS